MNTQYLLIISLFFLFYIQTEGVLLPVDTARLRLVVEFPLTSHNNNNNNFNNYIINNTTEYTNNTYTLFGVSSGCFSCSKEQFHTITAGGEGGEKIVSDYINLSSRYSYEFTLFQKLYENETIISSAEFKSEFGQHGSYSLWITVSFDSSSFYSHIREEIPPNFEYLPLILSLAVLVGLIPLAYFFNKFCMKRILRWLSFGGEMDGSPFAPPRARVQSVDTFRGVCLVLMIFVNYGGGKYWIFEYADWNGLTIGDMAFPWLLFIMGLSIVLSFDTLEKKFTPRRTTLRKVIKRTIILFALGLFVNNGNDISHWRIPGVLQRFSISYCLEDAQQTQLLLHPTRKKVVPLKDVRPFWPQWLLVAILLAVHCIITFCLQVPDCPTGYLGPGGISDDSLYPNCTGGAAGYIDRIIFGLDHMNPNPSCKDIYKCSFFDTEGILGYFTSIATCFFGVQAGRILTMFNTPDSKLRRWALWGMLLSCIGVLLTSAKVDEGWIPINKSLWSVSFTFVTGGAAFLALLIFYIIVDSINLWTGVPFSFVGKNSILIYLGQETLKNYLPFCFTTPQSFSSHGLLIASNLLGTITWVVIAYIMHKYKFYVSV